MCILMVDDEALILELMAETLTDAGFDVLTATDGPGALALFEERVDHISVLISDFHLPQDITGMDLLHAVRRRRPDIPVILATGRPDALGTTMGLNRYALVVKPYRPSDLVKAVRRLLAA